MSDLRPTIVTGGWEAESVVLYLDREIRTIVVGHAGRHRRDTSNPHL
ncbi:MAG: hypothetical protein ACK5PP_04360 [Acidimicrobiales bacterium]